MDPVEKEPGGSKDTIKNVSIGISSSAFFLFCLGALVAYCRHKRNEVVLEDYFNQDKMRRCAMHRPSCLPAIFLLLDIYQTYIPCLILCLPCPVNCSFLLACTLFINQYLHGLLMQRTTVSCSKFLFTTHHRVLQFPMELGNYPSMLMNHPMS